MKRYALLATCALIACSNQTGIQRGYVGQRDDCQNVAEDRMAALSAQNPNTDEKGVNAKLVRLFSDCMFESGWSVATPQSEEELEQRVAPPVQQQPQATAPVAAGPYVYYPQAPIHYQTGRRVPYQNPYRMMPQQYYVRPQAAPIYQQSAPQSAPRPQQQSSSGGVYFGPSGLSTSLRPAANQ